MTAMTFRSTGKAAIALAVSTALAASLALAAPATAQAKTVKAPAKVKKPTVSKVKATSFKVTWKKAKRAKGYQVKVLKGSRTVKTITVKKRSCYATGLSSKTTYKVKVRAYSQSGKKTKYGKWSSATSVTTLAEEDAGSVATTSSTESSSKSMETKAASHTHSWTTDVGLSSKIVYYCLECGVEYSADYSNWGSKKGAIAKIRNHASKTGHVQCDTDGYEYHDGAGKLKKVKHEKEWTTSEAEAKNGFCYNYYTLVYSTAVNATDVCNTCGATREHTHSWKLEAKRDVEAIVDLYKKYGCGATGCEFETENIQTNTMTSEEQAKARTEIKSHINQLNTGDYRYSPSHGAYAITKSTRPTHWTYDFACNCGAHQYSVNAF